MSVSRVSIVRHRYSSKPLFTKFFYDLSIWGQCSCKISRLHSIYTQQTKKSLYTSKSPIFPEMFHIRPIKSIGSRWISSSFWYQTCKIWLINKLQSCNHLNGDRYVLKSCKCYHSSTYRFAHLSLALYSWMTSFATSKSIQMMRWELNRFLRVWYQNEEDIQLLHIISF